MNLAAPFDLGIYGAFNNWFVARRAFATSVVTLAQMAGLVAMPLIAQFAIAPRWLARRLAGGRRGRCWSRIPPGAGCSWPAGPRISGCAGSLPRAASARARADASRARAGAPHAGVLAAAALYRARLPGAGRRQPAPGAVPDRARHRRRRSPRTIVSVLLAHLGARHASPAASCRGGCRSASRWPPSACCSRSGTLLHDPRSARGARATSPPGLFGFGIGGDADPAAGRLGGLLRAGELRGDPRPRALGAGPLAGRRADLSRGVCTT